MPAIDFYNVRIHPITGFLHTPYDSTLKNKINPKYQKCLKAGEFEPDLYMETTELMRIFNVGSYMLSNKIKELSFDKITYSGRKYVLKSFENVLRDYLQNKPDKVVKLDHETMISTTQLSELYGCKAWERFKVVEASELRPILRNSGKVYYDKEKILPFFEAFKDGTIEYKKRKKK